VPNKWDAKYEVESAYEMMTDTQWHTDIEYTDEDEPVYQKLDYDNAKEYAEQVTKMGKRIPDWDRGIDVYFGGENWFSSDSYSDRLSEELEEYFEEEPAPPGDYRLRDFPGIPWKPPKEQGRFKFPQPGMTISSVNSPLLKKALKAKPCALCGLVTGAGNDYLEHRNSHSDQEWEAYYRTLSGKRPPMKPLPPEQREKLKEFVEKWRGPVKSEESSTPNAEDERMLKGMGIHWTSAFLKKAPLSDVGQRRMEMARNQVLEEVDIGDYELYLVRDGYFGFHQIGMQRRGMDMTDMRQQEQRIIPRNWGRFDRKAFKATIQRWLSEHHLLVIGSHNAVKTRMYSLALRAIGFRLKTTDTGHLSYIDDGRAEPQKLLELKRAAQYVHAFEQQGGRLRQVEEHFRAPGETEEGEGVEGETQECPRCDRHRPGRILRVQGLRGQRRNVEIPHKIQYY
jgi:hypothetical protein